MKKFLIYTYYVSIKLKSGSLEIKRNMPNITLSLDADLMRRGRDYAQTHGTSLNALIRKLLDEHTKPADTQIGSLITSLESTNGRSGGKRIQREELQRNAKK